MNIWTEFLTGLFWGLPFGIIWNIPKYGKALLLMAIFVVLGGLILNPNLVAEAYSSPWYLEASNLLGIIIGQFAGQFVLNQAIEEWKK